MPHSLHFEYAVSRYDAPLSSVHIGLEAIGEASHQWSEVSSHLYIAVERTCPIPGQCH